MRPFISCINIDLASPCLDHLYCVDASLGGYCVMTSKTTEGETRALSFQRKVALLRGRAPLQGVCQAECECQADHWRWLVCRPWLFQKGGVPLPGGDVLESAPSLSSCSRASVAARDMRNSVRREVVGIVPSLPDSICESYRWHTVIQGQWSHQEHIMLMEGGSTLFCARREARNSHSHGCMLGILRDHLSSTLAFDKGRSMNFGLLALSLSQSQDGCDSHWV